MVAHRSKLLPFACVAILLGTVGELIGNDRPKESESSTPRKRLLLLSQGPDGHPWSTHEYLAGARILAQSLQPIDSLQCVIANADEPWAEGPELIESADGVVIFLSQGARWIHQDPARLAALNKLAERGGAFVGLHWGIGCKDAEFIDGYLQLVGGCHGGPDRKYKVLETQPVVAATDHPIMRGVEPAPVKEEFYYTLKFVQPAGSTVPLLKANIDGELHTVAWAWQRPDGGRSFGFSGGHFHENWRQEAYRRMVTQAILWTMKIEQPATPLALDYTEQDITEPRPKPDRAN